MAEVESMKYMGKDVTVQSEMESANDDGSNLMHFEPEDIPQAAAVHPSFGEEPLVKKDDSEKREGKKYRQLPPLPPSQPGKPVQKPLIVCENCRKCPTCSVKKGSLTDQCEKCSQCEPCKPIKAAIEQNRLKRLAVLEKNLDYNGPKYMIRGRYSRRELVFARESFRRLKIREIPNTSDKWDISWCIRFPREEWANLRPYQKVNCIPNAGAFTRKDRLHENIVKMKEKFGEEDFSFWPVGFILPKQFEAWKKFALKQEETYQKDPDHLPLPVWILKPPLAANGRHIQLVTDVNSVDESSEFIQKRIPLAQSYLTRPFLLNGYKLTCRVYVAVTSLDPLRVYTFPNGLVRICSKRYEMSKSSFEDQYIHLDSYDINHVREKEFVNEYEGEITNDGLRCDIVTLLRYIDDKYGAGAGSTLWEGVRDVVAKSLIAAERSVTYWTTKYVKKRHNSFDIFGYDIFIDEDLKPWLLEINSTPSMAPHTKLENSIKLNMIHTAMQLVDISGRKMRKRAQIMNKKWPLVEKVKQLLTLRIEANEEINDREKFVLEIKRTEFWVLVDTCLEMSRSSQWQVTLPSLDSDRYIKYLLPNKNLLLHRYFVVLGFHASSLQFYPWCPSEKHTSPESISSQPNDPVVVDASSQP